MYDEVSGFSALIFTLIYTFIKDFFIIMRSYAHKTQQISMKDEMYIFIV